MKNLNEVLNEMSTPYSTVYVTSNYESFGFISGNREINSSNLEKIKESLKTKQILESAIIVGYSPNDLDGKVFKIIEGQHRFVACKQLGLPLSFIVRMDFDINDHSKSIADIQLLNTASKEWDVTNFMGSRATLGEEPYVRYKKIYDKYKSRNDGGFEHEILFYILNKVEGRKKVSHKSFKEGVLVFTKQDMEYLDNKLQELAQFLPKVIDSGKRYYLKALSDILDLNIDKTRLSEKLIYFKNDIPFSKQKEFSIKFLVEKVYNQSLRAKKIYMYRAGGDDILLQVK
jgi:hypothetical protein